MRNDDVGGKSAIDGDADMAVVRAQILFAAETRGAGPAPDPGIDGNAAANDGGIGFAEASAHNSKT